MGGCLSSEPPVRIESKVKSKCRCFGRCFGRDCCRSVRSDCCMVTVNSIDNPHHDENRTVYIHEQGCKCDCCTGKEEIITN